jgi:predicted small integral membrane protein
MIRTSKILCILAIAFYCFLDVFGNVSDYSVNFAAVERTLMMTDIFPDSLIGYRAITNPILHHVMYLVIIGLELLTTIICGVGAWKLFKVRHANAVVFNGAKNWAVAGLTLGFLTWQVIFMSVAGEWFGIWMSSSLRGAITTAFQIFITFLILLVYLIIKDE